MEYGYEDNLADVPELLDQLIIDDIRNPSFGKYLQNVDIVFHFAGISSLPECESDPVKAFDVNTTAVSNLLNLIRYSKVKRFVFASTSAVYEKNQENFMLENTHVYSNLIYSTSKMFSEQICRSYAENYGMDIVICRFFNVYGPHQDFKRLQPPFTSYLIREIPSNRVPIIFNTTEVKRDYIFIDDILVYLNEIRCSKKQY